MMPIFCFLSMAEILLGSGGGGVKFSFLYMLSSNSKIVLSKHCIEQTKSMSSRMSVWDFWPKHKLLKEMFTQPDLKVRVMCPIHADGSRNAADKGMREWCEQRLSKPMRKSRACMEGRDQCLWSQLYEKKLLQLVERNRNTMGK